MSQQFHREDRYIVIKHKDLGNVPVAYREHLVRPLFALQAHLPVRECVVVESDWPEHEMVWQMIDARVTSVTPTGGETSIQAKRVSDCPAERLAQRRGVDGPVAAEDVRAVVEESVAFELKKCADGYGHGGRWCGPAYNCWLDLRDRKERDEDFERRRGAATQRSVVLPERKPKTELGIYSLEDEGYNACLDDIARLNK